MANFGELRSEQARQIVDAEQVFGAYEAARHEFDRRFTGSLSWKRVGGRDYIYRKRGAAWKALGPRTGDTERMHASFHDGRTRCRDQVSGLAARLDEMAPVNRALRIGRLPTLPARLLRAMSQANLLGSAIDVVGTHALYAYERMTAVQIAGGHLATGDVDLLNDSHAKLKLLWSDMAVTGLMGLLRRVDRSFEPTAMGSFRAVNRDGFIVDLIQPLPPERMAPAPRSRIGAEDEDLAAVEIEGLAWLVNSPKVETVVIDARGYPLRLVTPDPRAFALHKAWLADRPDRDPLKRRRDAAQARLVAELVTTRLPHLRFDDPILGALPRALRARAAELIPARQAGGFEEEVRTPGW